MKALRQWIKSLLHRHKWEVLAEDAIGEYSKRGSDVDRRLFVVRAEGCFGCMKARLVPKYPGLRIVECEPIDIPIRRNP